MATNTGEALVEQVVKHVEQKILTASFAAGARLPSERTVAADLKVSRNTVTAAYNDLEQRGVIRRIRGS